MQSRSASAVLLQGRLLESVDHINIDWRGTVGSSRRIEVTFVQGQDASECRARMGAGTPQMAGFGSLVAKTCAGWRDLDKGSPVPYR